MENTKSEAAEPLDPLAAQAMRIIIDALLQRRRELAVRKAEESNHERNR